MKNKLYFIDVVCKYLVLFALTGYIGYYIYLLDNTGEALNLPDWLIMLFALVFQYFFRRAPKKEE